MEDDSREFVNEYGDFQKGVTELPYDLTTGKISKEWKEILRMHINHHLQRLEKGLSKDVDPKDYSVYTGMSGISILYLHLASLSSSDEEELLKKSLMYSERALKLLKGSRLSFLCGDPGPLAVAAVIYHKLNLKPKSDAALERLQSLHERVVDPHSDIPDEILFGRAGYLFALLYVQKHISRDCINPTIIKMVIDSLIKSGLRLAKKEKWKCPLMYKWHDKHYLGAAHGVSGILYMLLQEFASLTPDERTNLIKPTIDFLMTLKFPSGNYPSSIGNKSDRLIHWCHGAPGFIHLFAMAYKVFGDESYLREALSCGDVIWERGLLKKGYGICHGVSGNGFSFLLLYRITKDPIYLYRAVKFAEWCFEMEKRKCRTPDRPMSLFEGLAGPIYYFASLLNIETAAFPAFQLW